MRGMCLLLMLCCGAARADITSNLIAHWKFDNDLTEEVSSADMVNGSGTATFTTIGLPFTGPATTHSLEQTTDDRVGTAPTNVTGLTGAWTYAFWFKTSETAAYNLIRHNAGGGSQVNFRLASNKFNIQAGGVAVSATSVNTGSWVHIVATYDGTNESGLTIYINGSSDATGTDTDAVGVPTGDVILPVVAGFAQELDDLRIYSRELSSGDVTELYNFTGAASGPAINPISSSIPGSSLDPIRTTIP